MGLEFESRSIYCKIEAMRRPLLLIIFLIITATATAAPAAGEANRLTQSDGGYSFIVAADMRNYSGPGTFDTAQYFRGVLEAASAHSPTAFLVVPGDLDPPAGVDWSIKSVLGSAYPWFPVVGNHEAETPADMEWLRAYDTTHGGRFTVHTGPAGCPETTYSFDYANSHLVVLNQYCDTGGDAVVYGDVNDHLYNWLAADLAINSQPHVFVFGHEPAYPQPDVDNGRERHIGDSLDAYPANRDRFWNLLVSEGVQAYFTGHTHNYSVFLRDGVWQIDAAHASGLGDSGARSTVLLVHVRGGLVAFNALRDDAAGGNYTLRERRYLNGYLVYLPLIQ